MPNITVHFKDGSQREFADNGRPGGSYRNHIEYEGSFAIVIDCYENRTIFPAESIAYIDQPAGGGRF